jgi:NitT/TauT family transport system substrate-binding protein
MYSQYKEYQSWLLTLVCLMLLLIVTGRAVAQNPAERPLEKVTIAYSSVSGNMAPLWVAYERGYFRKHGLDAQLVFIESGSTAVQSLISQDVAFAQMAGAAAIQSQLRGSDVVLIAGFLNTLDYQFMVDKSIAQPDQLKGKAVAVSRFGSSSDFATRYALEKYGLVPQKDVTILEIGSQPARFAALESGQVQGAMVAVPATLRAKALGFHALADLQMLGLEYQHTALATTQSLIKSRPDLVRNVMRAFIEAVHYYKTQRAESLNVLAKYLKTSDAAVLNEVYENIGLTLLPQKPYPTLRGIAVMLRELSGREPKAASARPEQFVDLTFITELDSSGFIDSLYKTQPDVARREPPRAAPSPTPVIAKPTSPAESPRPVAPPVKAPVTRAILDGPSEYVVVSGDTLSHLALRHYGDPNQWPKIFEANKETMKSPHYIYVGQRLMIPS